MIEIRVTPSEDGYELHLHGGDSDILKQLVGAPKWASLLAANSTSTMR